MQECRWVRHEDLSREAISTLQRPRILVAEDHAEMRVMLADMLRRDGYDVSEAEDGWALIDLVSSSTGNGGQPFDLIISDIRMPGWSGLEVLVQVRQIDWAMAFILITAFGDEQTHRDADRLGALAVFDKPFDLEDLRTLVLRVVPRT